MYRYKSLKRGGKRIDEHRLLMVKKLGRPLTRNEVVHHVDGDCTNNSLDNLIVMTRSAHSSMHMKGVKMSDSARSKLSRSLIEYWKDRASPDDKPVIQLTLDGREVQRFRSARDAQRKTGHFNGHIIQCCQGKRKTHHGFKWCYA